MHFIRKVLRWLSSVGFKFCLLMVALTASFGIVFESPDPFKQALKQSGIYDNFFSTIFEQANKQEGNKEDPNKKNDGISLNDPEIQKIIQSVIPSQKIQSISESTIDSVFKYVQTGEPKVISINLDTEKLAFIDGVAAFAEQKINALPICSKAQLRQQGNDVDPFNAICRPTSFDISKEKQQIKDELLKNKDLTFKFDLKLEQEVDKQLNKIAGQVQVPVISSLISPLKKPGAGRWITNSLNKLPLMFAVLSLLFALAMFLLYEQKRAGLHSIASTFLGNGIFLALGGIASMWFINTFNKPGGFTEKISGDQIGQIIGNNTLRNLGLIFNKRLIIFGIAYAVTGFIIVVIMRIFKPKNIDPELKKLIDDEPKDQPKPPIDDSAPISKKSEIQNKTEPKPSEESKTK